MDNKRKLSSICELKKGKKVFAVKEKSENSVPYLLIDTLRGFPATDFTTNANYTKAIPEDILIVGDGANSGLVGTGLTGAVGSTIIRIRLTDKTARKDYIMYYLRSKFSQLNTNVKGAAIPHLKTKEMLDLEIRFPDEKEQELIVAEIEKQFTRLDSAIESLQTIKKKLEVYRKSVLKAAFGGYYSKNNLELKEVLVNGIKTKIPLNWTVEPLGNSVKLQGGFAFKSKEYVSSGIPIVKIANVQYEDIDWSDKTFIEKSRYEEFKDYQLKIDDVLIAMTRPIIKSLSLLKTVVVKEKDIPSLLNQRVGRFLIKNLKISKDFLKYYIFTDFFKTRVIRESSSSQQPNISSKKIENFDFILPNSDEEQNIIIQNIELQFSIIDNLKKTINTSLLKAETLRKSILKSAFEGKLVRYDDD